MEIAETIYEGVVETSNKKLLEQMLTVLLTEGERKENSPRQKFTPR